MTQYSVPLRSTVDNLLKGYLPKWQPNTAYTQGDIVVNSSGQIVSANATYTSGTTYSASNWTATAGAGAVASVAGKTGTVTLTPADVALGNVNNTSDAAKPISTATQTALNLKTTDSALATVAKSGSYADLANKPTVPTTAAQVGAEPVGLSTGTQTSLAATYAPLLTAASTYTWNPDGTIAAQAVAGATTTYAWNSDGSLHTETRNGVTRTYVYNGDGTLASVA